MVRKAKTPNPVRVLDEHDDRSLHQDQRSSIPDSSKTSNLPNLEVQGPDSNKKEKVSPEVVAKALGASYFYLANQPPMEVDLGLDISSSITGVVLMDKKGNLIFMDHVPLTSSKYKNLFDKADAVMNWIKNTLPRSVKVTRIFVEANAKGYSAGFSSADTLFTLAKINALVSYLTHKWFGAPVIDVNVTSARSRIGYKNNKAVKKPVKEKVREFVLTTNPNLPFQTRTVTIGKNKGAVVPAEGVADEIDAWVICRGGQALNPVSI